MGKLSFLMFFTILVFTNLQAQQHVPVEIGDDLIGVPPPVVEEIPAGEEEIFKVVEEMPVFPGGQDSLMKFLSTIVYPNGALKDSLQGTSYVQFVIGKDGTVRDVVVSRSSGHPTLDAAARNHVLGMPNWKPGKQRGKPVNVQLVVPIKFKLD